MVLAAGRTRGSRLASRAEYNAHRLLDDYRLISAPNPSVPLTPAAEWLIDNHHIVERQLQQIRDDLPRGFYRQLPKLSFGHFAGYPRILSLAWTFIEHTDSQVNAAALCSFVSSYQTVETLTIGELWALATILRIVLIENLRRCADRVIDSRTLRSQADAVADEMLAPGTPADDRQREYAGIPLQPTFLVRLVQRLRDQDPSVLSVVRMLEDRLAQQEQSMDVIVHDEHQRQAAANLTVRNIITSLRELAIIDWTALVEQLSVVDAHLRTVGDFKSMDFATRTRYRDAIEELARGSGKSEAAAVEYVVARAPPSRVRAQHALAAAHRNAATRPRASRLGR